jgi:hypothetical protein
MSINKNSPIHAQGTATIPASTGFVTIAHPGLGHGLNHVVFAVATLIASTASEVAKAVTLTTTIATDKKSFTIYAWKHTSDAGGGDPTLVANTALVSVSWFAQGE